MEQPLPVTRYPLPAKRGFTLIELITVIIIISIMVAVALPKYTKMMEKTKASNAKRVLDILRKAEDAYYAENTTYSTYDTGATVTAAACVAISSDIKEEIPHSKICLDSDWQYIVTTAGGSSTISTYTATAKRRTGKAYADLYITIDNDGTIGYSSDMDKIWK